MTEAEGLVCTDPMKALSFLSEKTNDCKLRLSDRKLRLFALACCRRVRELCADDWDDRAVGVVERFADGFATTEDLGSVRQPRTNIAVRYAAELRARSGAIKAAAACSALRAAAGGDPVHPKGQGDYLAAEQGEKTAQCRVLRELFGNPFHAPPTVDPSWLVNNGGTVAKIAHAVYDERELPCGQMDPTRLAILADALEEVGCDNRDILHHCRGPRPHVRGCWVIDLILGKE